MYEINANEIEMVSGAGDTWYRMGHAAGSAIRYICDLNAAANSNPMNGVPSRAGHE